jgi:glutamine synthetase
MRSKITHNNDNKCMSNKITHNNDNNKGINKIMEKIIELNNKTPVNIVKFNNIFGANNTDRLCGKLETSKWNIFNWGIGTRHTSVRIPSQVFKQKNGYFEDRRPGANVDPFEYINHLLF